MVRPEGRSHSQKSSDQSGKRVCPLHDCAHIRRTQIRRETETTSAHTDPVNTAPHTPVVGSGRVVSPGGTLWTRRSSGFGSSPFSPRLSVLGVNSSTVDSVHVLVAPYLLGDGGVESRTKGFLSGSSVGSTERTDEYDPLTDSGPQGNI